MSMLQASPSPLLSVSVCIGLLSNGQLSQLSPTPSLSESNCRGLYISGQLSCVKKTHIHMDVCIRQDTPVFNHGDFKVVLSHPFICDAIIVIIRVTGIALSVRIQVFLSRVWQHGAIILQPVTTKINGIQPECSSGISQQVWMILAHAEVDILPFHSDRWHSACRVIYYWASHPDQSPHHTGSHRQQTPPHTHTCTRPQTPGQGIYTQHTCGKCVCCLCKGYTVHTPTNRAALWESKNLYG